MSNERSIKEIKFISIENLIFDPENPRLPSRVDATEEEQVLKWMLEDATLIELMLSIGEHGYFPGEPLLGVEFQEDKYTVVEGNRRLAAAKFLQYPGLATIRKTNVEEASSTSAHKPQELPVVIFLHRNEILDYLGYRHITGIKEWPPLAKARYLLQLYERLTCDGDREKFRILARRIGSRSDYVARLLAGLKLFMKIAKEDYFGIQDIDEETIAFSLLTTAINYTNIARFLGLKSGQDPSLHGLKKANLEKLLRWVFEKQENKKTRIRESRNLKLLNSIVASDEALEVFEGGASIDAAAEIAEMPTDRSEIERFRYSLSISYQYLERTREYAINIDVFSNDDSALTEKVVESVKAIEETVNERLPSTTVKG